MVRDAVARELREEEQEGASPPARIHEDMGRRIAALEDVILALLEKKDVSPDDHYDIRHRVVNRRRVLFGHKSGHKENFCRKCKTGLYSDGICIFCGDERDT